MAKCKVITLGAYNYRIPLLTSIEQTEAQHNPQLKAERQILMQNEAQISTAR